MGLYDTINVVSANCPICGKKGKLDVQTKDLGNSLSEFYAIPFVDGSPDTNFINFYTSFGKSEISVGGEDRDIDVIVSCHSTKCVFDGTRKEIVENGYIGGFSNLFRAVMKIRSGYILNEFFDVKICSPMSEEEMCAWKDVDREQYDKLMRRYLYEPIAISYWESNLFNGDDVEE